MPDRLARLTELAVDDAVSAFGLDGAPAPVRRFARLLAHGPSRSVARDMVAFDDAIGRRGLAAPSAALLRRFVPRLEVAGADAIPREGPLLLVANHPGLFDAIALFAAIPRDDVLVVARDHPFTAALPHLRERILEVPEDASARLGVVRAMAAHLAGGGAVLTFPAGAIEPDPAVRPHTATTTTWAPVAATLGRLVDGLVVVPLVVSGVHTRRGLDHPLTRLRRDPADRDWLGAVLQLLAPPLRAHLVRVDAGAPLAASAHPGRSLHAAVLAEVARLVARRAR